LIKSTSDLGKVGKLPEIMTIFPYSFPYKHIPMDLLILSSHNRKVSIYLRKRNKEKERILRMLLSVTMRSSINNSYSLIWKFSLEITYVLPHMGTLDLGQMQQCGWTWIT
jgi:hypothetical protein